MFYYEGSKTPGNAYIMKLLQLCKRFLSGYFTTKKKKIYAFEDSFKKSFHLICNML